MSGVQITTNSILCTKSCDDTDIPVIGLFHLDVTIREHQTFRILYSPNNLSVEVAAKSFTIYSTQAQMLKM
jgi:hypothetical protein